MQEIKSNEISFRIVNRHPNTNKQDVKRRRETVRADLYHIFKKYH